MTPDYAFEGLAIEDRNMFVTPDPQAEAFAKGQSTPSKELISSRKYRGPLIKPLIPTHIANQIRYKDELNVDNLTNMQIIKKHVDLSMVKRRESVAYSSGNQMLPPLPKSTKIAKKGKLERLEAKHGALSPPPLPFGRGTRTSEKKADDLFLSVPGEAERIGEATCSTHFQGYQDYDYKVFNKRHKSVCGP